MGRPVTTPDLTGRRFGRLLIIRREEPDAKRRVRYLAQCDCGNTTTAYANHLLQGATKSCGCGQWRIIHGDTRNYERTPEFTAWASMFQRCENENNPAFKYYGGRGIKICDRWRLGDGSMNGFECFLADVGRRPSPELSIDRYPNNDGPYEPGNVRWATKLEQTNNKRDNRHRPASRVFYRANDYPL
jgi:hypothetical protein